MQLCSSQPEMHWVVCMQRRMFSQLKFSTVILLSLVWYNLFHIIEFGNLYWVFNYQFSWIQMSYHGLNHTELNLSYAVFHHSAIAGPLRQVVINTDDFQHRINLTADHVLNITCIKLTTCPEGPLIMVTINQACHSMLFIHQCSTMVNYVDRIMNK